MAPNALAEGDLNGDGPHRTSCCWATTAHFIFLAQNADHTLAEPQKISYSGTPKAVQIADVDGDGQKGFVPGGF